MSETVAVVGSREGADLDHVARFLRSLWSHQPDTILVSGGAIGVDKTAETLWLAKGGRVLSFRPRKIDQDVYEIARWELGGTYPMVSTEPGPTWCGYGSAAYFRDLLIAEAAKRVVAFFCRGKSRGTQHTIEAAIAEGREYYEYEAGLDS